MLPSGSYLLSLLLVLAVLEDGNTIEDKKYWQKLSHKELFRTLRTKENTNKAKNVILFLGDGLGIPTLTAARAYKGYLQMRKESPLSFDEFPNVGLLKTYSQDNYITDSAAAATAYLSGVKTNLRTVGVDANVKYADCDSYDERFNTRSFFQEAAMAGKSVGIISTNRLTGNPASATYAHTPSRKWERDEKLPNKKGAQFNQTKCPDIAVQFLNNAMQYKVALGAGFDNFFPGKRLDKRNLTDEWLTNHRKQGHKAELAFTGTQLRELIQKDVDYLLGIFADKKMKTNSERIAKKVDEPSLVEMVFAALNILKRNKKGFVLFVENGLIDSSHHHGLAKAALEETIVLDEVVREVMKSIDTENTLVMVTGDHSHTMTISGSLTRGKNILGVSENGTRWPQDDKPMTVLAYANGYGGLLANESRVDPTTVDTTANDFTFPSLVKVKGSHGAEDVAVFATGPWSHLFRGLQEQTMVAEIVRFAACFPPYAGRKCRKLHKTYGYT